MKAIIYAGIGLFSVASVYGLADYYQSQKKGVLNNLYREEEVINETGKIPIETSVNRDINLNTGIITVLAPSVKKTKKIKSAKRTIRLEEFSRGRIIEPVPVEIKKEEPKKMEEIKLMEEAPKSDVKSGEVIKTERRIGLDMFSRASLKRPVKRDNMKKESKMD